MVTLNANSRTLNNTRPDIFQILLEDENGQNILGIDDGALRQSLRIEVVNTSGRDIEFQPVDDRLTLENYHFAFSFRPGTLSSNREEDNGIVLKETDEGWQMQQQDSTFYLRLIDADSRVIGRGDRITFTLENISAAPEGGSRGTRVEIKYNSLRYEGSNETIAGNKLQYLNIVNQRGKKQIPLYVGFLGSNTILNDGTENELTLTIQTLPNSNASLTILDSPEITEVDTTRWQGDIFKFLEDKIADFSTVIRGLGQNSNLRQGTQAFFGQLDLFIEQESLQTSNSFELLKQQVNSLNLQPSDKSEIVIVVINSLGIISEDDLNAIATRLGELLSFDIAQVQTTIQQSTNIKVIKSQLNSSSALKLEGIEGENSLDRAAKFTISFDVTTTDNDPKNWALVEKTDADDIQISIERGQEHWIFGGKEEQGITPRWNFVCQQGWSLQTENRQELLRLKISNLKTKLLSGYANLYVHYENIPGYWDGYITIPIHKGPLVYREYQRFGDNLLVGCVGIGIDKPQAKLHVKSPDRVNSLRVDGNTLLVGRLAVTGTDNYSSFGGKVGIGTTNPAERLQIADFSAESDNYLKISTAGGNRVRAGIKFRVYNDKLGFTIENDERHVSNGLNILRHSDNATGISALFIDKQNGNVGIGTTNPGDNKLKVQGDTAIAGNLKADGTIRSDVFRPSTDDWEIARNGEHLEIREPEQNNKVWAKFNDDKSLHLIGTPNLWVDGYLKVGNTFIYESDLKILKKLATSQLKVGIKSRKGYYIDNYGYKKDGGDKNRTIQFQSPFNNNCEMTLVIR